MTPAIDQSTLGRWHALQSALDLIAPLANAATDAIATTPAADRVCAQSRATTLEGLRDRLVASLRLAGADVQASEHRASTPIPEPSQAHPQRQAAGATRR